MDIKSGSKYYPLLKHLKQCDQIEVQLTFAEIETILGSPLPASARNKKNWWSNRDSETALQAGAWVNAGYHAEDIDLKAQTVTFKKFHAKYKIQRQDGEILWREDAIRALRKHMNMTQAEFAQEVGVRRQTVSEWENGLYNPDRRTTKFLQLIARQAKFRDPTEDLQAPEDQQE